MNDTITTTTASRKAENLLNQILGGAGMEGVTDAQNFTGRSLGWKVRVPQGHPIRFWIEIHATDEAGVAHQAAELVVDISRDHLTGELLATVWFERTILATGGISGGTVRRWDLHGEWSDYHATSRSLVRAAVRAYANLV